MLLILELPRDGGGAVFDMIAEGRLWSNAWQGAVKAMFGMQMLPVRHENNVTERPVYIRQGCGRSARNIARHCCGHSARNATAALNKGVQEI